MTIILSDRFVDALRKAVTLHKDQVRKASQTPYLAHLMTVAALVLENGGSENHAIAALLHDAVEDAGGLQTLNEIREEFGEFVADLVDGCTDSYTQPKQAWKPRKAAYLEKLKKASNDVKLISLADKVHNARSILIDLRNNGESTWDKFNGKKQGTLWYYQSLVEIFHDVPYPALRNELKTMVNKMLTFAASMEKSK